MKMVRSYAIGKLNGNLLGGKEKGLGDCRALSPKQQEICLSVIPLQKTLQHARGFKLAEADLLYALLAAHLDDEDCSAASACAQLDFVCASVYVEVLLGDDLTHGVHEHCGCVGSLACVD